MSIAKQNINEFDQLKQRIHGKLIGKLDLSRVGELEGDVLRREIRVVVEHLCDGENNLLNRSERDRLVETFLEQADRLPPAKGG